MKRGNKSSLRPLELLVVNGRHLGFTFLIDRISEFLAPDNADIYGARWTQHADINGPIPNEQNFDLDKSRQKFHHSLKEHHKISNIPRFRCEML
jgi:hypothetical protein